jgi:DNA replication initiation complex subunit (GINS family)
MNYRELYENWKKEKESENLQPTPEDFYIDLSQHIQNLLKNDKEQDRTIKSILIRTELQITKQLTSDLFELRFKKMLYSIVNNIPISVDILANDEKIIYKDLLNSLKDFNKIRQKIIEGPESTKKEEKKILIRLLQGIPAIIGADMETYGPFKEEDIAALPVENAEALIKRGIAVKVTM